MNITNHSIIQTTQAEKLADLMSRFAEYEEQTENNDSFRSESQVSAETNESNDSTDATVEEHSNETTEELLADSIVPVPLVNVGPTNYRPILHSEAKDNLPQVIRIIGNGGVGKTLLSLNLACYLTRLANRTLVVGDQFTVLYAKSRVPVELFTSSSNDFGTNLDFIIFDGIDSESPDSTAENEQKWLIVKNNIEYNHYVNHYRNIIYNDSDGFFKKPLKHIEPSNFLTFSELIFKTLQQREELMINSSLFQHLLLFNQFNHLEVSNTSRKKGFSIKFV